MMNYQATELPVLSVWGLTQSIKMLLEGQFRFVCVQGEVSNCKLQTSGHFYFSLKDPQAQISAVMFKADAVRLGKIPKDGDQIIVKGSLNVYAPSGRYQITVRTLEWAGLGALLLKLEELRAQLKAKGFFSLDRKKNLPKFPKRIGVVTSPTGAVIQDILNVLTRRFSGFQLILNPVKVQGEGAAQEIAAAIDFFNKHQLVDVMIVGRGGGSIEDLWAFNEELVAEAIFRSVIPIISAVGHESDHCIADDVADARAPTPSAAAEMVIAEKAHQVKHIYQLQSALQQTVVHLIRHGEEKLQRFLKHPLLASPYALLGAKIQKLDDLKAACDRSILKRINWWRLKIAGLHHQNEALKPSRTIQSFKEALRFYQKNLDHAMRKKYELEEKHLMHIMKLLKAVDPKQLLSRGYSIVISEKEGSIIHSSYSLSAGARVKLLFSDGTALATIDEMET